MTDKKSYFYGFRNKETGIFKSTYLTTRYNTKTAVFIRKHNAVKALSYQKYKNDYEVAEIIEIE